MAATGKSTRPDPADRTAAESAARARLNTGTEILRQLALSGTALGGKAALGALRGAVPLLEVYAATTREAEEKQAGDDPARGLETLGLKRGEALVLRRAAVKALLEAIEISSLLFPVHDGAPVYRSRGEDGRANAPQLVHLLALGRAAAVLWERWQAEDSPAEPPQPAYPASQTVAYVATRPGEYQYLSAPQQPAQIRRYAMRQRSLNTPQPAMLPYSGRPGMLAPAQTAGVSVIARRGTMAAAGRATGARAASSGCGCHGRGGDCGCGCGGGCSGGDGGCSCGADASCGCGCGTRGGRRFAPARYGEDGSCANPLKISCETRWRLRECVKLAFCDLLRCVGNELCDDDPSRPPDFRRCAEDAICNLLQCLPDAICPPEPSDPCCGTAPAELSCGCNFAVGK